MAYDKLMMPLGESEFNSLKVFVSSGALSSYNIWPRRIGYNCCEHMLSSTSVFYFLIAAIVTTCECDSMILVITVNQCEINTPLPNDVTVLPYL